MKVGVSGASGKLGTSVIGELKVRAAGHQIVGISRTPDRVRADDARFGDYDSPSTLVAAYQGLDRLLIITTTESHPEKRSTQNLAAIDAAVAAGVGHVVFLSSAGARAVKGPDAFWASYYAGEQWLMHTASKWSILRTNHYAEALFEEAKLSMAHGAIAGLAENKVAFVSRDDIAAAAAGLLLSEGHEGAIYNATGPKCLSGAERAEAIAAASGQRLAFAILPEEKLRAGLAAAGLPDDFVNFVVGLQKAFAAGGFDIVTGDIERLSGKPPRPLLDVLVPAFAKP